VELFATPVNTSNIYQSNNHTSSNHHTCCHTSITPHMCQSTCQQHLTHAESCAVGTSPCRAAHSLCCGGAVLHRAGLCSATHTCRHPLACDLQNMNFPCITDKCDAKAVSNFAPSHMEL